MGDETGRAIPSWCVECLERSQSNAPLIRLPEFLEIRRDHTFFECCQTPALASALTLQPIDRYPLLDASIIFCDILVVPQAMGLVVLMEPQRGPVLPDPLVTPADFARLRENVDVQKELGYVFDAITLTRKGLDGRVPLIGFCGAPWTLMAYMVEGGGSKTFQKSKEWLYRYPEESKALLMRVADVCADLLVGQVLAGAQVGYSLGSYHFVHIILSISSEHSSAESVLTNRCSKSSTHGPGN
jgi:uroporphyrinogen decarboxylase